MFETLKLIFDTFGKDLMVPVMIFIICKIFKTPTKKAFSSAVLVGVGLKGMTFITTEFGAILSPLVQQLVEATGLDQGAGYRMAGSGVRSLFYGYRHDVYRSGAFVPDHFVAGKMDRHFYAVRSVE